MLTVLRIVKSTFWVHYDSVIKKPICYQYIRYTMSPWDYIKHWNFSSISSKNTCLCKGNLPNFPLKKLSNFFSPFSFVSKSLLKLIRWNPNVWDSSEEALNITRTNTLSGVYKLNKPHNLPCKVGYRRPDCCTCCCRSYKERTSYIAAYFTKIQGL